MRLSKGIGIYNQWKDLTGEVTGLALHVGGGSTQSGTRFSWAMTHSPRKPISDV